MGALLQDGLADGTVGRNITLTLNLTLASYIYDYITKLCRQQAEVIQNHENANVRITVQGEPRHRKYKRL
jgi:hypothetical protein